MFMADFLATLITSLKRFIVIYPERLKYYKPIKPMMGLFEYIQTDLNNTKTQKTLTLALMRNNYHVDRSEDSVSKISRSKSRNQISTATRLKQLENKWNGRFHLEHIPEYNYQNQPHSQYLKNKFRIPTRKNDLSKVKRNFEPSLEKNKVSNKPNPRKNEERIKEAINKAFSDLKTLWYEKKIPACHMEYMTRIFNRENYPMKILEDIKHEFSEINKETSLIQKIIASIQSRDVCFQKIMETIQAYNNQELSKIKACKHFQEKISHFRILTIHCIECIYQWKQAIEALSQKKLKPTYIQNGKPYLSKIVQDFHEISNSSMNQIYCFEQKKPDPFFLQLTLEGKKISNVSKNLIKRVRVCEIMLSEEVSADQENKRTPLIQKIKLPPSMKDKSMPPQRPSTAQSQPFKKLAIQYSQFGDYLSKLLEKSSFGKSFLPQVQIAKYEEITIFQHSQSEDEVVFASDRFSSQRKIILLAIKSSLEKVQETCRNFCEYLWEHDNCTEIRVSLVHHQIGQNLSVDSELQKKLKMVGFRWVSVNQSKQVRMTVFAIKRPLDTVAHKTARRKQAYPVIIEHLTVFSLLENNQKKFPSKSFVSVLTLLDLLRELKKEEYEEVCRRDQYFSHLESIKKIENYLEKEAKKQSLEEYDTFFKYSGLKAFQLDRQQNFQKIFKNLELKPRILPEKYPQYISLLNTSFKFGCTTINDGKFIKFFPNKQNQILICQSNYPIYLLPSDEEMINFFIIEVEQNFSMQTVDTIFHSMGQQSSFIDEFWLPNFSKGKQYVDEVGLRNSELISTDYWTILGSLTRKSRVRTKVIKPPFVFGVIHKKLLQILEIPLYYTLINKENIL